MDRERLTELLQDPSQVAPRDLGDLRSMTERFPWFSGAHLLLAVGEHAKGDVLSNDPARIPAAYLPSRAVLFDLTQAETMPHPAAMHVVKDVPAAEAEEVAPAPEEQLPQAPTTTAPVVVVEERAPGPQAPVPEPATPAAESLVKIGPLPVEPVSPAERTDPPDLLDAQIREAARLSGYDLAHDLPPLPSAPLDEAEAFVPMPPKEQVEPPPHIPSTTTDVSPPTTEQRTAPVTKDSRLRFTEWLSVSTEAMQDVAASTTDRPSGPTSIASLADEALPDPTEIIERFIQQAVPAVPSVKKAEFFSPQQAAKRSLQDDGLVSETLAKVYEQQGDITKAIEAYARLAIIHPEKSVYFAALSKALEARSNK